MQNNATARGTKDFAKAIQVLYLEKDHNMQNIAYLLPDKKY